MHNHRKLKSSHFCRDLPYPERILSRHKYYKKSGLYTSIKSFSMHKPPLKPLSRPSAQENRFAFLTTEQIKLNNFKGSKILLAGTPQLYCVSVLNKGALNNTSKSISQVGLQSQLDPHLLPKENSFGGESTNLFLKASTLQAKQSYARDTRKRYAYKIKKDITFNQRGLRDEQGGSFVNGLLEPCQRYFSIL